MKILVTGAAGMLAAEVIPVFLRNGYKIIGTDINRRLPDIEALDVTDAGAVSQKVKSTQPDYVFHLAAETNVDLCEKEPEHAFRVNAFGTKNIVEACKKYRLKLLYISTGGVFGGKKDTPYTELDKLDPVNVYGKSKLEGEVAVRDLLKEYFIVRAGWMVGGWELDKKFVYKIVNQLKDGKKTLTVVNDKFGSPTFTKDFAANLANLIDSQKYGLYHMANKGTCSRYEMSLKIVEFMGLEKKVKVNPVDSSKYPLPAPRARSEMMENRMLERIGLNDMPRWEDSLREYINENKNK